MELKSKRLKITALTIEQLTLLSEQLTSKKSRAVTAQIINEVNNNQENYLWYTQWAVYSNDVSNDEAVGYVWFKGAANENHIVELGYDFDPSCVDEKMQLEIFKIIGNWAFKQKKVYYLQITADPDHDDLKRLLTQNRYKIVGGCEAYDRWELEKPASMWLIICSCLGLSMGALLTTYLFEYLAMGVVVGFGGGFMAGAALDFRDKQLRKKLAVILTPEEEAARKQSADRQKDAEAKKRKKKQTQSYNPHARSKGKKQNKK